MKVTRNSNGNINVELESQHEITALWAVASNIRGSMSTPRVIFSNNAPRNPGLAQQLVEHIESSDVALMRYGVMANNPPPNPQDMLAQALGVLLAGDMAFTSMPPKQAHPVTETENWSA